jgi:hypothetical protein
LDVQETFTEAKNDRQARASARRPVPGAWREGGKREVTVEGILHSDTYVTASALKKGGDGVYVNEVYQGRLVSEEADDKKLGIKR